MALDPAVLAQTANPPNPLEMMARVQQVRNAQQQQQIGAQQLQAATLENQQRQLDLQDQQNFRQAYMQANGDPEQALRIASQKGVSPKTAVAFQQQIQALAKTRADLDNTQMDVLQKKHDALNSMLQPVEDAANDPATQEALFNSVKQKAIEQKLITPQEAQSVQYQGPASVHAIRAGLNTEKYITAQAAQLRAQAAGTQADVAQKKANAELPGLQADALQKQIQAAAPQLEAAAKQGPDAVAAVLDQLPHGVAKRFEGLSKPGEFTAAALTPEQSRQAAQAAANAGETARHNRVEEGQGAQRNSTAAGELNLKQKQFNATFGAGLDANGRPLSADEMKQAAMRDPVAMAIASYQMAPPTATLRSGAPNPIMSKVMAINPDYKGDQFAVAKKTQEAFTSGSEAKSINAINTVAGHLSTLNRAAEALNNGDLPALNRIANALGVQLGRDPVTTYKTIINRVAPEMTKAYVGAGGGEGDRLGNASDFDPSLGAQQIKSNIAVSAKLLQGKIKSLQSQYENAIPGRKFQGFISPEAQQTFDTLGGATKPGASSGAPALPSKLSASDVGKTFTSKAGKTIKVTAVNPQNPMQFKFDEVKQ